MRNVVLTFIREMPGKDKVRERGKDGIRCHSSGELKLHGTRGRFRILQKGGAT